MTDCLRFSYGAPEGIRTPDLSLRRGTLYPAELRAQRNYFSTTFGQEKPSSESDVIYGFRAPPSYKMRNVPRKSSRRDRKTMFLFRSESCPILKTLAQKLLEALCKKEKIVKKEKRLDHVYQTCFCRWSERWDSNPRPSGPEPDALPSCATSRTDA